MKHLLDRRSFLLGTGAGLGALALGRPSALAAKPRTRELIIGGFQTKSSTGERAFSLVAVDRAGANALSLRLPFHVHGFAPHPKDPWRAVLFEKKGPGACEVDLVESQVLRTLLAAPGYAFYGHGVYSADGKRLYATESRPDGGIITVRDGRSLEIVGQMPTHGAEPHDCRLVDQGKTLVVTNGGGPLDDATAPPCVTYVDVKSSRLIERVVLDNPRFNTGHLDLTRGRDLIVVSAPRKGLAETELGGVSIRLGAEAGKAGLLTMKEPRELVARLKGETLSVSVHEESSVAAATTPDANLVSFWHLRKRTLVASLELEYPRGVTLVEGGRYFVISCGVAPRLVYVSTQTLKIDETRTVSNAMLSSSHLYRHEL